MKTKLLGKTPDELKAAATAVGLPAFTGRQIAQWMYAKRVRSFDEMTNISKAGREKLAEKYDGKVDFYKVDVDKEEQLAAMFGIQSIPSLLFIPMKGELG